MPVAISNLSATWSNSNLAFTAISMNVANNGSNADSRLLDLKIDGVSKQYATPNGDIYITGYYHGDGSMLTGIIAGGGATDNIARLIANTAYDKANSANILAFQVGGAVTIANTIASAAFDKANAANVLAFNTGAGSNTYLLATIAGANTAVGGGANAFATAAAAGANAFMIAVQNGANTAVGGGANNFTSATIAGANTAVGTGANTYLLATLSGANTAVGTGANAFTSATISGANTAVGTAANNFSIATFSAANNTPVGNTLASLFTSRSTRRSLNFLPGTNITINVDDDSAGNRANITVSSTAGTGDVSTATLNGANTAVGAGANAFSAATISGANTAVGTGANAFTSATISGANTAIGAGANAFTSATISGANTAVGTGANTYLLTTLAGSNTAVGTGANTYLLATIAGANTAVGGGANAFATAAAAGANAFTSATISGANTAIGAGANAFTSATISGANTAVGTGANAFTSATISGANTAVGTGANTYLLATIAGANTAVGTGANAFTSATIAGANTAVGTGANNFSIATFGAANNTPVGNTLSSLFTSRSTRRSLNFIPGTNVTINVDDDSAGNRANITVSTTAGGDVTTATLNGANTAVGGGANAFTSATIAGANTAVGTGANNFASATIAGANTAVGTGANNFLLAVIAGANTAVGTAANNFAIATIAGANTAVGTAANNFSISTFGGANNTPVGNTLASLFTSRSTRRSLNFIPGTNITINIDDDSAGNRANITVSSTAGGGDVTTATLNGANTAVGGGANAFTSATIAGANTAVGTGANAFTSATIAGANTAVGTAANNFASATIAGANTAVGTGANTVAVAAFAKANAALANTSDVSFNGNLGLPSGNLVVGGVAGGTLGSKFAVNGGALGTGAGNTINAWTSYGTTTNADKLVHIIERNAGGSDWTTANHKLARIVDVTTMGWMKFGSFNSDLITFGEAATEYVRIDGAGNVLIGRATSTVGQGVKLDVAGGANVGSLLINDQSVLSTIAGANTAVGTGANAFTSATIAGANTAVGAGANTVAVAAFAKANATTYTSNLIISVADNTNAALRITQTGTGEAIRVEDSANPDSTPFVVDANGKVLIGTTIDRQNFLNASLASAVLQVEGTGATESTFSVVRDGASANPPRFLFGKSRGASVGTNALVQSGDGMGTITFQGNDGSEFVEGAVISASVDGTAASDSMPGRLEFSTSSTSALVERMRIDSSGNVLIGRTNSTVGLGVKLDVNGAVNASAVFANGSELSTTSKAIAMSIIFG